MDPNANLQEQESILTRRADGYDPDLAWAFTRSDDTRTLRELRQALIGWIRGGGFEPDWSQCPRAAKYYGMRSKVERSTV
jgi:hypothetical protein